jgi:hypothetical protein
MLPPTSVKPPPDAVTPVTCAQNRLDGEEGYRELARDASPDGAPAGLVRSPDYRDDLADLIDTEFPSRRAFCQAMGISEDLLSHVLANRKNLSLNL